jgi:hypothetical protein
MSNEENANTTEETVAKIEESVSQAAEKVEETASKATDAAASAANNAASAAKDATGNLVATVLSLKESNPKLFYGLLAVIGIPLIIIMSSGRNPEIVSGPQIKNLTAGQKYVLKSSNAADPSATVRLVAVPGALSAYDDTEEADRNGNCQHLPQGTPVTAMDFSPAFNNPKAFVKVQVEDGPCKGTINWVLGIDVQ